MSDQQKAKRVVLVTGLIFLLLGGLTLFLASGLKHHPATVTEITQAPSGRTSGKRRSFRETVRVAWENEDGSGNTAEIRIRRRRQNQLPGVGDTIEITEKPFLMEYSLVTPIAVCITFCGVGLVLILSGFRIKKKET